MLTNEVSSQHVELGNVATLTWLNQPMTDAANFRREAARYRKLAEEEPNPEVAQRMRDFASHYDGLAEVLEEAEKR